MKFILPFLFLASLFLTSSSSLYGQCNAIFAENIKKSKIHDLKSKSILMVSKRDYDYSFEFNNSDEGLTIIITTKSFSYSKIKPLDQDDKIMFVSAAGNKRSFDFIYENKKTTIDGNPAYVNSIQITREHLKWLANSEISQIRQVNMVKMQMYPWTISPNYQEELKKTAQCFLTELDPSLVNEKTIVGKKMPQGAKKSKGRLNDKISNKNSSAAYYQNPSYTKKCRHSFSKNTEKDNIHYLITQPEILVARSDFDYILFFQNSDEGLVATVSTTGHSFDLLISLGKDDKLMFVNPKGERHAFDFVDHPRKTKLKGGRAAYINTVKLGLDGMLWLAENPIQQFRIVSMSTRKMYPYSLDGTRQSALKDMAQCFLSELNASKIVDGKSSNSPTNNTHSESTETITSSDNTTASQNLHHDLHNNDQQIWNLNDMTLNSEEAAKKYLSLLDKELASINNQVAKEIKANVEIGKAFFEQKRYDKAIPYFEKALDKILKSKSGEEKESEVQSMLASILINKKNYKFASGPNKRALELWKKEVEDSLGLELRFKAYMNQGVIFENLDSADTDIDMYVEGPHYRSKNWKKELNSLGVKQIDLPDNSNQTLNFNLALLSFKNAQTLIKDFDNEEQIHKEIEVFLALGDLYFKADDLEQAKTYYSNALDLINQHYDSRHPKFREANRMLAEIALGQQLYENALAYIDQAQSSVLGSPFVIDASLIDNIDKIPAPHELIDDITTKGVVSYHKNKSEDDLKKVLEEYDIASKMLLELRKTHKNEGADYRLDDVTDKLSQHAVLVCNKLHETTNDEDYLNKAFEYAELAKSGTLYEISQDLKSAAGIPTEEIEKENGLKSQLEYLKSQVLHEYQKGDSKNDARIKKLNDAIETISKEHQKLLDEFETKYPDYHALKHKPKTAKVTDLQKVLAKNEIFLEYVVTDSFVYALAVSNKEIKGQFVSLNKSLSKTVKTLQHALRKSKPGWYEYSGTEIYKAVIGDLAPFLKDKKLIIAADAELHYIPFGVLPVNRVKTQETETNLFNEIHYLIQDHPICYNYSASSFVNSKYKQHNNSNHQIATWAPHFDSMKEIIKAKGLGEELAPLPDAEKEARLIAQLFGNKAHVGQDATEAKFKTLAGQYTILHIATHGVLNDIDPLSSSLILSNEGKEDGILNASELYEMKLNANMAVLSACNSGMGRLSKAEGVIGVASGFAYAGVPNIVMSKWPVSDWSTAVLMKSFYENLKKGMPKDEALQLAKIKYLEETKNKGQLIAPFFWGGFVLNGNTEPIDALNPLSSYYWLGGLGLLLILAIGFFLLRQRNKAHVA